ncbi:MAG TPA: DUF2069 domain-containing protein [Pseudomonadales bacterium]|nr:DUF2069 domain-containing protein [Pseudomonadales bacterium]
MNLGEVSARLTFVSYLALLTVFTVVTMVLPPEGKSPNWAIWLVLVAPLLIFFNGVRRRNKRSLAYLCFAILLYFVIAVNNAFSPVARVFDYLEVALIVIIFTSATLAIRFYKPAGQQEVQHD